MTRCSQTAAWRLIRACADIDAGRLRGYGLRYNGLNSVPAGTLAPAAARDLDASLYRPHSTPAGPDTIWYVVSSDGTPVAWLTRHAVVVTPPADLTGYQLDHQTQAVAALSAPTRRAIHELAKLRDLREQRSPGGPPDPLTGEPRLLVADPADPTLTFWTRITADPHASRVHLAEVTGITDPTGEVLIIDAYGYGYYGRDRDVFTLPVLCAVEHLAAEQHLPPSVIGDWLHREGATTIDVTGEQIMETFTAAYAGVHYTRRGFAQAERDRHGWTTALAAAGIPERYFDLDAFATHLFHTDVHGIHLDDGRVAVFRRT